MAVMMEGPLSKWTNVVKGWQYRWFMLDDNAGLLSYYTVRIQGAHLHTRPQSLNGFVFSETETFQEKIFLDAAKEKVSARLMSKMYFNFFCVLNNQFPQNQYPVNADTEMNQMLLSLFTDTVSCENLKEKLRGLSTF